MLYKWAGSPSPLQDDGQKENIDSKRLRSANPFASNLCKMNRDLALSYDVADSDSRPDVSALFLIARWVYFGLLLQHECGAPQKWRRLHL
eukprot:10223254-Karenia_brevis.AAC.1